MEEGITLIGQGVREGSLIDISLKYEIIVIEIQS